MNGERSRAPERKTRQPLRSSTITAPRESGPCPWVHGFGCSSFTTTGRRALFNLAAIYDFESLVFNITRFTIFADTLFHFFDGPLFLIAHFDI